MRWKIGARGIDAGASLGDASASMQVAVDAASIVACSVCASLDASLSFFNGKCHEKEPPRTVDATVAMASSVRVCALVSYWPLAQHSARKSSRARYRSSGIT